MLFTDNLEQIIFNRHQYVECDELIIISGYVGPSPIQRLSTLPIRTTVVYGMYGSESISYRLHNALIGLNNPPHTEILYSNIPVHTKCYIWRRNGNITYALIGSANFSTNGLNIPQREALAETTNDTFGELNNYISMVLSNSVQCNTVIITPTIPRPAIVPPPTTLGNDVGTNICFMELYNPRTNEVPPSSGLNWGFSAGHTVPGDAYITIRTSHIREFPNLFPPKQTHPTSRAAGRPHRQNDSVELIWDDGTLMNALLEGTQTVSDLQYPKQLSSFPSKNTLGAYIRRRLSLSSTDPVTKADLDHYGRDNISISLLQNGAYFVDFSV
ncbi:restriction endonuclease PLD domain-containing protein [Alkalihalobacillus sp. LMS39]|uniref:restriction endonuclease PLD domain-containing protein n=1 Tax=Alkalihalobacillus sp. LMS39 TaxID=2924032 RepID=UPI001FB548C7|nr:restriction endonuclease PLD domain-containing protein [Alkalihalobacillus sp. LMS39]UOE95101.1 NgoFVII family restriction endonuclease [Alkalihalobacillus sp. LMS39]